jgi:ubiquinone biosynthesis protein COQ9
MAAMDPAVPAIAEAGQEDWAEAAEARMLDAAVRLSPELGWSARMADRAAAEAGLSPGEALLVIPYGARDLAALLSRRHDARALVALGDVDPKALKMRERITRAVEARLDAADADGGAVRRWSGYLALPQNMTLAARLVWESADGLWRWAGDTATDENHYSKRAILAGILAGALAIRLSSGAAASSEFLNARVANVMAFESWKAGLKPTDLAIQLAGALGRLRYGGR